MYMAECEFIWFISVFSITKTLVIVVFSDWYIFARGQAVVEESAFFYPNAISRQITRLIKAEVFLSRSYLKTSDYLLEQSSAAPEQFSLRIPLSNGLGQRVLPFAGTFQRYRTLDGTEIRNRFWWLEHCGSNHWTKMTEMLFKKPKMMILFLTIYSN